MEIFRNFSDIVGKFLVMKKVLNSSLTLLSTAMALPRFLQGKSAKTKWADYQMKYSNNCRNSPLDKITTSLNSEVYLRIPTSIWFSQS